MSHWWRDAVVYQVYVRSFADSDGDGVGDLPGITAHLPHIASLGADAVWITPFFTSPMADHGYDVADYCDVDPLFGSLADLDHLLTEAHRLGLRVIVDLVPNHTSDQHPWFHAHRDRYLVRPDSPEPPNNWTSVFGGPAWSRLPSGEWYLHLFAPEQPDVDWRNAAVHEEWERILRFWLDRGVDGFRIDVAHGLYKDAQLRDNPEGLRGGLGADLDAIDSPYVWDQPETLQVYERWRQISDGYHDRVMVGEVFLKDLTRVSRYVADDRLHQAFNFLVMSKPFDAAELKPVLAQALDLFGDSPTWVLSNHDLVRHATRYGGGERGRRRALAATAALLALPGSPYLYQGEELGLEQSFVPPELRQDPMWFNSGKTVPGRDGCRTPMPWTDGPGSGFTTGTPWLPFGSDGTSVAAQAADPASPLSAYRSALALRRSLREELGRGVTWLETEPGTLGFTRSHGEGSFGCLLNTGPALQTRVPRRAELVLDTSGGARLVDGALDLPADCTVWLRVPAS
ncbi:MAG TPA: alpha-amylase family glycosyl hydrolase [Mycobacteriales bacterium]|nr:alpha-amylase family glycosyl hydrolase [Mycobacteriales bacterium]